MRLQLRVFAALMGIGAIILGARWYLHVTKGVPLTDADAFMNSLKSVAIASVVMASGIGLSIKAFLPKQSA